MAIEFKNIFDSANQAYDNTTSGLTATNAKDAIDELAVGGIKRAYILCLGQSNMACHGASDYTYTPTNTVKKLGLDGTWIDAVSPSITNTLETHEDTRGGNYLGKLGDDLITATDYEEVYFLNVAVGGSFIQDWLTSDNRKTDTVKAAHDDFTYTTGVAAGPLLWERVEFVKDYCKTNNINIDFILWHQGESDHTTVNSATDLNSFQYREYLKEIRNQLINDGFNAPMLVAKASFYASANGVDTDITTGQSDFVDQTINVYDGPNTDVYTTTTDRISTTEGHFNATGLPKVATDWVTAITDVIDRTNANALNETGLIITQGDTNKPAIQVKPNASGESTAIWLSAEDGAITNSWGIRRDGASTDLGIYYNTTEHLNIDTSGTMNITSTNDVSLINNGALLLGSVTGLNMALATNEIQARDNGTASVLSLQLEGGNVVIGDNGGSQTVNIYGTTNINGNLALTTADIDTSGTKIPYLNGVNTWSGTFIETSSELTSTIIDCNESNVFTDSISTNTTYTFSNWPSGSYSMEIHLTVTSGVTTLTFTGVDFSAAPTLGGAGLCILIITSADGGTTKSGGVFRDVS